VFLSGFNLPRLGGLSFKRLQIARQRYGLRGQKILPATVLVSLSDECLDGYFVIGTRAFSSSSQGRTTLPIMLASCRQRVGTRCFSSSLQFSTTVMGDAGADLVSVARALIRNFWPSAVTS
jgi:hypothetical protein